MWSSVLAVNGRRWGQRADLRSPSGWDRTPASSPSRKTLIPVGPTHRTVVSETPGKRCPNMGPWKGLLRGLSLQVLKNCI